MKAVIYTRVSTEEQVKEGFSLAAQLDRLRSFCDSQGWDVADVYTDEGVSAKNTERPELNRLLRDCPRQKFDVVVVYRLDRLTRSVMDLYKLLQLFDAHKIGFRSATEVFDTTNAVGRLFLTIVAALAQWERENLGERIRMGFDQKKREGKWHSTNVPYGYHRVDDQLVIAEEEAEIIREMFRQYIGGLGVHRLVMWLRERTGRLWTSSGTYYSWLLDKHDKKDPASGGAGPFAFINRAVVVTTSRHPDREIRCSPRSAPAETPRSAPPVF